MAEAQGARGREKLPRPAVVATRTSGRSSPRYWLVHTLSQILIREMAMYSGYGAASLTERITSEFHRIVSAARQSVTAATYNFQDTSQMWAALKAASGQPGVVVTV